ncbi:MAG: ribulokinase [Phycisphaeraceae bacterium]|nr:MAG: ribulokinase [Phycisphaeraceae bacterium]
MAAPNYAIGVDYGTNSVRALVVDCRDGTEVAEAVFNYPSGTKGIILDPADPHLARQHPGDYVKGFVTSVKKAVGLASANKEFRPDRVVGIGVDTTGSTPLPIDADGTPLGMLDAFRDNPHAQAWLWKDHTSHAEAAEITALATERGEPYLAKCGGVYSSEWFWSKILRCRRVAPKVFKAAKSWVELADFVPAWITGNAAPDRIVRGVCAAGHKAMFNLHWGGLPSEEFLAALHPDLAKLRSRLYDAAVPSSEPAGMLTPEFAKKTGLPAGIPVAAGAFDAHHGAVGSGVKPGNMVKIIGTSTCDITVWPSDQHVADIPGVCGIVDGSVVAGMLGIEAGQSAVGDIFNWVASLGTGKAQHVRLTEEARALKAGQSGLLTLDWHNGNRTVLVNPRLTGLVLGQTLHTTHAELYRSAIEATAYGARAIIERHEEYGVEIKNVTHCGGIGEKNDLVNQIYADILGRPIRISRSAQTCALGAAIFGSVVGGAHKSVASAQRAMVGFKDTVYKPRPGERKVYDQLFRLYRTMHDAMGGVHPADSPASMETVGRVMPELMAIRDRVTGAGQ